MSPSLSLVEKICRLPIDYKVNGKSPLQIVEDSGYTKDPDSLTVADIEDYLRGTPDLIDAWLTWSADKRVSSGWYFMEDNSRYAVGYYPNGERVLYPNSRRACAEFILREVGGFL